MSTTNTFPEGSALIVQVINIKDKDGNPTQLSVPPTFVSSDPTLLNLTVAPDGLSASGTAARTGTVIVTVTSGTLPPQTATIVLTAGQAVSFDVQVTLAAAPVPPAPPTAPPTA